MEYKTLGKTGLKVSRLSLGSWLTFGKLIDDSVSKELMYYAYDNGINFFDNAEIYARGNSEIVMGKILKDSGWRRDSYIVSSKVFFGWGGGKKPSQLGLSKKHVFEACHAALKRLQLDYLDLYYCHRPDPETPIEETVWAMHQLIMQGKILYWGTSEWPIRDILKAHKFAKKNSLIGPIVEQPEYNMFARKRVEHEYQKAYNKIGLGTTIWSPLASGVLTDKYLKKFPKGTRLGVKGLEWLKDKNLTETRLTKIKALNDLASSKKLSLAVMAIAWCLQNKDVSTVILGASNMKQLEENLSALEVSKSFDNSLMNDIEFILNN